MLLVSHFMQHLEHIPVLFILAQIVLGWVTYQAMGHKAGRQSCVGSAVPKLLGSLLLLLFKAFAALPPWLLYPQPLPRDFHFP